MRSILAEHIMATLETYRERHNREPERLCIGRWDARELAHVLSPMMQPPATPRDIVANARGGTLEVFDIPVQLDARLGRCPAALWWQP